jgi:hypothetical protein
MRETNTVEVRGNGKKYRVELDRSKQVLLLDVPGEYEWDLRGNLATTELYPSAAALEDDGGMTSAALLGLKAKQFDDGLYAAVELASSKGLGEFPSRDGWLAAVDEHGAGEGTEILSAAIEMGGGAEATGRGAELVKEFLDDPLRSKPLGFYTWNKELVNAFRRDRMLQTELDPTQAESLRKIVTGPRRTAYTAMLRLNARLTNPLAGADLFEGEGKPALLPPSLAHETELMKKLYGDTSIPEGFNLGDELLERIRSGELDLTPDEDSGWYDHQTYALEAIAAPDRMPEGEHLELSDSYRRALDGLFKALLASTRETHVKQLEVTHNGAALDLRRPLLHITPNLTTEPLPSYYLRRARSYAFIREVLVEAFGGDALSKMHRLTAEGPLDMALADELDSVLRLFCGAYLTSAAEIGLAPVLDDRLPSAETAQQLYDGWREKIGKDPDLGHDVRMMVPVFYDIERKKTKVWAVLGLATFPLVARFKVPPKVVAVHGPLFSFSRPKLEFESERYSVPYLATAEVYVDRILDREELCALCDENRSYDAIVAALQDTGH